MEEEKPKKEGLFKRLFGGGKKGACCSTVKIEEIPDDRKVAEAYARGDIAVRVFPEYRRLFQDLLDKVTERAKEQSI